MVATKQTLTYQEFRSYVQATVPNFKVQWLNQPQDTAVCAPPSPPVFIVAGPGTGKTTVLALRVLKHIFVDGFLPDSIMATTFTRKAAKELRSRVLSWGVLTHQEALKQAQKEGNQNREDWLSSLDINAVLTGTLDSLAEELIKDDRQPGEITPTVIEKFVSSGLLRRNVMFTNQRYKDRVLEQHLSIFNPGFPPPYPGANVFAKKLGIIHSFADRSLHDSIDLGSYAKEGQEYQALVDIVQDYHRYLQDSQLMDFALLEEAILLRLLSRRLVTITSKLNALLVDEFQDTNYLQEQIYYELCRRSDAAFTVVGDDDQSIYRFRGATVEIFSDFENRISSSIGPAWKPTRVDLTDNYRSTERIVKFCSHFISAEPDFQIARSSGKKPCIPASPWAMDPNLNFPIIGMFRHNLELLANDLSLFLGDIFRGSGGEIPVAEGKKLTIQSGFGGNFGDSVLLTGKVDEENYRGASRLPLLMRQKMKDMYGVEVYNPRGRTLAAIPEVAQCLGLMLQCIDPDKRIQESITSWRNKTKTPACLDGWRSAAERFAATNPNPGRLQDFLNDWAVRRPSLHMNKWPSEWPLLELMYTIIAWIPFFHNNPEGQVYLEAISRVIAEAGQISRYNSQVLYNSGNDDAPIREIIREVYEPIAEDDVEIDEEIMPYVPRSNFPIMTIHQAKGLEFPLVIVDVGSDYRGDYQAQRKFRYPEKGDDVHYTEDHIADFSPVGPARLRRGHRQRAFDDVRRLYYVAKSRPQYILMLVGMMKQLQPNTKVRSIATGDLLSGDRMYHFSPSTDWTSNSPADFIALI